MAHCPTCGQSIMATLDAQQLFHLLTNGQPHRWVYRGRDDRWYVTYGGGEASATAVRELINAGKINSKYSSIPSEAYHVGRTVDCERTLELRRRQGRKAPLVYVCDT